MGDQAANKRWTRSRGGRVVHADSDEHVALVLRTLCVGEVAWAATLDRYCEHAGDAPSTEQKLVALAAAFREVAPFASELAHAAPVGCAACGERRVEPVVARSAGVGTALVYGRCQGCGHGQLLAGASDAAYAGRSYYERRASDGSGYADYAAEREYREAKGRRLVARLLEAGPANSLLEVGSGYGFTLQAARAEGLRVMGVDVNPDAGHGASELYRLETVLGTSQDALDTGAVAEASWDIVLYQFVLEHVVDPRHELRQAARALARGGRLVLVVPSMATFEVEVFGGSYRSLRGDHLHLFSRPSLERLLAEAGLELLSLESHCSLDLVRGFLDPAELSALYAAGRGPDFTAIARAQP